MSDNRIKTYEARDTHFRDIFQGEDVPRPPYQMRAIRMICAVGHWPAGAELPSLPDGLSPSPERTGVIGFYHMSEGRPIAPGALLFAGIAVRETHAPDGRQAAYLFHGGADGAGMALLGRCINAAYLPATVTLSTVGTVWSAACEDANGRVALHVRPKPETLHLESGTNYYIGPLDGQTCGYTVSYSLSGMSADVEAMTFDVPEDHPMAIFRTMTVDVVLAIPDIALTYAAPFPLELATPTRGTTQGPQRELDAVTTGTLDAFARIGRSLAIIEDTGRVICANAGAEALLSRLTHGGPPRLVPPGQAAWQAARLPPEGIRMTLPLADGATAVARVMPISLHLTGRPAMMVLMDDPAEAGPFDPALLLRLHGFTGSEARLATEIGRGRSPAEAAEVLGITRETARTVLKTVYGKPGIGRQAELARLVARFEKV